MRSKVALTVAVILGLLSAFLVQQYINKKLRATRKGEMTVEVVSAAKRMKKGTVITDPASFFEVKSMSVMALPQDPIMWTDRERYKDRKIMRNVESGDLIQSSFFIDTSERPDVQNIPRGMRAMTIAVDQITGVAGLLRPYSRVDIVGVFQGTFSPRGAASAAAAAQDAAAVTLLSDVTVWAVDSRTAAMPPSAATARRNYSAVTLVLSEKEAELLALAQAKGNLILTMREATDATYRTYAPGEEPTNLANLLEHCRQANDLRNARAEKAGGP